MQQDDSNTRDRQGQTRPNPASMPQATDLNTRYLQWRTRPNPDNMSQVIKALQPHIGYSVQAIGAHGDPYVNTMANVIAAQAVKTYNPDMPGAAGLHTHVKNQLQQLTRIARRSRSVLQVPERTQLDALAIHRAKTSFEEKHGREADVAELADHSGFSVKRIEKVLKQTRAVPSESAVPGDDEQDAVDFTPEAMDYVYHDADHVDRKILEHKTGYGGTDILPPALVAQKLGLTPSQLSRRSARLALKINELEQSLRRL